MNINSILISAAIVAHMEQKVAVMDQPEAFLHAKNNENAVMMLSMRWQS